MKIAALLESKQPLMEGGNLSVGKHEAEHLDLKVTKRSYMVPKLNELLNAINKAFNVKHKAPLWSSELLSSGKFLSGSSLHFFDVAGISDDTFFAKKPTVGDIDTMVDKRLEFILQEFLTSATNKQIGPAKLLGFQKGNEQYSALFELQDPPVKVQIDFEFVSFENGMPSDWARFSHSSSWDDIQQGVKGVFHKWLIQSLTTLTNKQFLLRKMIGRGAMRKEEDIPTTDNMYSFAVSSKEGGGLRAKYEPVLNPNTNKPLVIKGLPVMKAAPAAGYEQNIGKIFSTILGKRLDPKQMQAISNNFWSFTGLVQLMGKILSPEDKQTVLLGFLNKTIGKGSQGLYKNNPEKDISEKTTAINYLVKTLGLQLPPEFNQMMADYRKNYKMTELSEAGPNYKRQGIPHIYKPGSTVELKDNEFIELCKEIMADGGKLEGVPINLKVDGAGIRFGKDQNGRPFFMTSKVTEPKYIENFGDFEKYGRSVGQDEERLNFTKQYDNALKTILTAPFMKVIPSDTIVQAEMMYTPMAQQENGGLKFVNIPYDPKKLGKEMTLVPFMFKQFSTGQVRPDSQKIKEALLKTSNSKIKMVNNNLQHKGIDVAKIVSPIVKNADTLSAAVATRGTNPTKEKAKAILSQARQQLSNAIINGPIPGKDQLGDMIEGLVINMPSGLLAKVTSTDMANKMATKMAARQPVKGNQRPAVVAVGSAIGHVGHQQLFNHAIALAKQVGGQPYMFIGPAEGKDDPIPPSVKVETWHKLYPQLASNISTVSHEGGTLLQKIKHELINPQPGKPPRYDTIYIVVGSDRHDMAESWSKSLMKAVNKFPGYEGVKVVPHVTSRDKNEGGTGISGTLLRSVLSDKTKTPEQQFEVWNHAYNSGNYGAQKLPAEWIQHLMNIARKGMGMQTMNESRIFNPKSLVNVYYVSPNGNRHKLAKSIPYDLVEKLLHALKVKKNIDIHMDDVEVRPADPSQYTVSTSQFDEGSEEALQYATKAHAGQTRSGGDPYISHPVRVANHIKQFKKSHNLDALISAAYLHDTIEDTDTTQEILHDLFGGLVASLVMELTSDPEQIKKIGKAQYLAHKMAAMSSYALVIKLADRLDNVKDITTAKTPEWRHKYATETNHILDYIEKHRALSGTHTKLIDMIRAKLAEIDQPQQDVAEGKNMPDLEHVGERVVSVMDAERRLAHGDRIFAFHEMDEEPFEIHNVGELAGYDTEQLLAVPQSVAEEADEQKSSNVFQSMGSQLIAMGNDADKIKRHDPSVIEKAIDAKLEKINDPKLTHVTKSFLSKVVKFNRSNPKTMAAIFGFTFSIIARVSMQFSHNMGLSPTQATLLIEALLPTLGNFLGYIVNGFSVKDSVQAGLIAGTIGVGGTLAASGALSEDYLDEK